MKNLKTKIKIISLILIFGFLILGQNFSRASDCDSLEGDDKKKCEKLEEKAEAYQKLINLKNKEGDALSSQINNINSQKQTTANKIDDLEEDIDSLERDIRDKEKEIKYKKELLKGLIQADYENSRRENFELSILDNTLSGVFNQNDYLDQSGNKIRELMEEIEEAKNKLQEEKGEAEDKKGDLEEKKDELASIQNQKQSLLIATQGEEEKYRQLLARVEEQKLQLFDFSSFGNYSIDDDDRPKKKDRLSTSWYYSQTDSRWANMRIGVTSSKMKDYGCAITSVAMMYTYYGKDYSPKDILKKSDFSGDLIYWPSGWTHRYSNIYDTLDDILKDDDIAIIHVSFSGGGHFLVVGGKDKEDYIVHDPYFGSNIYLRATLKMLKARVDRVIYK